VRRWWADSDEGQPDVSWLAQRLWFSRMMGMETPWRNLPISWLCVALTHLRIFEQWSQFAGVTNRLKV
jgi:hypothetical protein